MAKTRLDMMLTRAREAIVEFLFFLEIGTSIPFDFNVATL
jgi:hypothetical protein